MNSHGQVLLKRPVSSLVGLVEGVCGPFSKVLYSRTNQVCIDGAIVAAALGVAYLIRFDGPPPEVYQTQCLLVLPFAVALYVGVNIVSGLYKRVWRFVGLRDAAAIASAVACAALAGGVWRLIDSGALTHGVIPIGVLLVHPLLAYTGLVGARLTRRVLYQRASASDRAGANRPAQVVLGVRRQVLLLGAGEAGLNLLRELRDTDYQVVGFLDDDLQLRGRNIGGWRVLGTTQELEAVVSAYQVDEIILCMPSATKAALQRIVARAARIPVKTSSVPGLWEIMSGKVTINNLRSVNMEDLLGRDSITHPQDLGELTRAYRGLRILVTGAGGSIGSELVRQLKGFGPSELILLDKDENSLYETACEIKEDFTNLTEIVADIRDRKLMERVFEQQQPDVVFHAAAYKHVPLMERYPAEAILTNVMGTRHLVDISNRVGVKAFVFVSTDKAVKPASTMGASKRVAEMILQAMASRGTRTRWCCVRFGNVLGSRASVVPLFQRQIRQGKNITITHPEVRRYFMTIPEAVQLVIQAGSLGDRGEIFLLDMGDPVKIVDLARNLIELSGLVPDQDVKLEFTGLRPGEKLNEELLIAGERGVRSTKYSKIFVVEALQRDGSLLNRSVRDLEAAAHAGEAGAIQRALHSLDIGYHHANLPPGTPARAPQFEVVEQTAVAHPVS